MAATAANKLAERLCRPQRIGLFGHRGVGKTTLLTMLYREAVSGRLPEIRLAAGDAATADYLADKVLQLESGTVPPATLVETPLRFQLYHHATRLEIIVKDYQGEHVAVGRDEPIREFLRDCDAVWLCFDPVMLDSTETRLRGEQEAEQLFEDYLKLDRSDCPHRPMALVLTKADLLPEHQSQVGDEPWIENLVRERFGMTMHALKQHAPTSAIFSVSSLGPRDAEQKLTLKPRNLDQPLRWLVDALQAQDEARLEKLFELAPRDVRLLERCVQSFAARHAGSKRLAEFERQLEQCRTRQRRRRLLVSGVCGFVAFVTLWLVDLISYNSARAFDRSSDDLVAVRDRWEKYLAQPLSIGSKATVRSRLREIDSRIREQKSESDLAALKRLADDSSSKTTDVLVRLKRYCEEFPDAAGLESLREEITAKVRPLREREANEALEELSKTESLGGKLEGDAARKHLEDLTAHADRILTEFSDTRAAEKMRDRRASYVHRIDEHDFEIARSYSRREPLNYSTRRERYQQYLTKHPQGDFAGQARTAVSEIEMEWDKHDFRQVRDLFAKTPADFPKLIALSERYLAVHEAGKFRKSAKELLSWVGRVSQEREYTVKLVKGDFSVKLGRWYTKGPDLSVEIEVNGIKHGPTGIIKNNYDPVWDHEFPRGIKWKPGDQVRIIVRDSDFKTVGLGRMILNHTSADDDKLALRLLSGRFEFDNHALYFESDFNMPVLPKVD